MLKVSPKGRITLRRALCAFVVGYAVAFALARAVEHRYALNFGNRQPKKPPEVPWMLSANEHGVAFYVRTPCHNSTVTYRDLTVYVVSSVATYAKRFPAIEKTWVRELEQRGATIRVFVGPGEGNFSDPRVIRVPRDVGPVMCVSQPPVHCDSLFTEHAEWLRDHVSTALVTHADDDTVFHPDRFLEVLRCLPDPRTENARSWMLGDCQKAGWEARAFCGGGASYTFSSKLLPWFARCGSGRGRADDVQASWCAMDGNATLVNHPSFYYAPNNVAGWVTAHHVPAERVPEFAA